MPEAPGAPALRVNSRMCQPNFFPRDIKDWVDGSVVTLNKDSSIGPFCGILDPQSSVAQPSYGDRSST